MNLGLRWEYNTPITEKYDRCSTKPTDHIRRSPTLLLIPRWPFPSTTFQVSVEKKSLHGRSYLIAYTYSKSIDTGSSWSARSVAIKKQAKQLKVDRSVKKRYIAFASASVMSGGNFQQLPIINIREALNMKCEIKFLHLSSRRASPAPSTLARRRCTLRQSSPE